MPLPKAPTKPATLLTDLDSSTPRASARKPKLEVITPAAKTVAPSATAVSAPATPAALPQRAPRTGSTDTCRAYAPDRQTREHRTPRGDPQSACAQSRQGQSGR